MWDLSVLSSISNFIKFQFQNFMKSDKATSRSGQQYAIWWVIGLYLIIIAIARFCCAHECNDNVKIRKKLMPFECFYYSQTIISKHCDEIDAQPLQKQRTYQARKVFKFKRGKTVNNFLWMCPSIPHAPTLLENAIYNEWQLHVVTGNQIENLFHLNCTKLFWQKFKRDCIAP